jgi:4'-phosphopantetheinyl transferase
MTERQAVITEARISASRAPDKASGVCDLVHVWLIPTDQPPAVLGELAALLDDEERHRAATHRTALQRARYVVAHGAARRIVAGCLDLEPGGFAWRRGEHGKPEPDVAASPARISISTSSQVALVAVAQPGSPASGSTPVPRDVGIDIERLVSDEDATRLSARFFPAEQAAYVAAAREHGSPAGRFATLWCRKEACVKALGGRLVQGLGLAVQGDAPLITRFPADNTPNYEYCVSDVPAPRLFRAAVALKGAAPYRLRCHVWSAGTGVPPLYRSHD